MSDSQDHIAALFAAAINKARQEAQEILGAIATALVELHAGSGSITKDRAQLLGFLQKVAAGDPTELRQLAEAIPYRGGKSIRFSKCAAQAFLDQAEIDAASGLSQGASVWVEVHKASRWTNDSATQSEPTSSSSGPALGSEDFSTAIDPDDNAFKHRPPSDSGGTKPIIFRHTRIVPDFSSGEHRGGLGSNFDSPSGEWGGEYQGGFGSSEEAWAVEPDAADDAGDEIYCEIATAGDGASPDTDIIDEKDAKEYRVWFGTNRKAVDQDGSTSFSPNRSPSVSYGYCDVYVPESHQIGSIGSSALIRLLNWKDDRLKLQQVRAMPAQSFWKSVTKQLSKEKEDKRHAVIFIHGYNVSFDEAALRTAQIGLDLGIEGAMAFFSWPSKGSVNSYPADGASIEASEPAITNFLVDFAEKAGATAVHVIAHSMGNRAVLRAVNRIAQDAQRRTHVQFANFILAAPDVDVDTFSNLADAYRQLARRTTLYVSSRDRAVELSKWLYKSPRVGFVPPISVFDGIDTVNVTEIDLTALGHGYIGQAKEVLADMHALIFEEQPPDRRFSLKPAETDSGQPYWIVKS